MTDNKVNEATWNIVKTIREANQAFTDSMVAAQERNIRYAQSVLINGMEVLKGQAAGTRALTQEMVDLYQKQQEAYQALVTESVNTYMDMMRTPVSYYKEALEFAEAASK